MSEMNFFFDDIDSTSMGVYLINLESGMDEDPIFGAKTIISDRNPRKDYGYFQGVTKEPIKFPLTFSLLEDSWTEEKRLQIFKWLIKNKYCKFYTADKPDRIFYIICTSDGKLLLNGSDQGYIALDFDNLFPYALSPVYTQTYDLSAITSPTTIQMTNLSNVNDYYYPEIEFQLQSTNTGVSIKNITVGGETITFAGLTQSETVYINNENKQIASDISGSYPINKCTSKQWLRLAQGVNNIEVTGKCILKTRMQFPIYA